MATLKFLHQGFGDTGLPLHSALHYVIAYKAFSFIFGIKNACFFSPDIYIFCFSLREFKRF
jgi:hypothetical protein